MAVDEQTLARARKLKAAALRKVLIDAYPQIWCISLALTGQENIAKWTAHFVCRQAIGVMPSLADVPELARWVLHHTVLTSRRAKKHPPTATEDSLLPADGSASPAYVAMIRAIRNLPQQQREAVILHYGMNLQLRPMAVAMDCSTSAATNHLEAARKTLTMLAGDAPNALLKQLGTVCQSLTVDPFAIAPGIGKMVTRRLLPRRILRILFTLFCLLMLVGLVWVGTVVWDQMER